LALRREEALRRIEEIGVIAVVRARSGEEGLRIAEAVMEGGIRALELTMTVPGAVEIIASLRRRFSEGELILGAGTVLDEATAAACAAAGADFVVSPCLVEGAARACGRQAILYMPGVATPTEVLRALEMGCDVVKVFPGEVLGPAFVRALKGPFPQVRAVPTGGVSPSNVKEWFEAGVLAVGVGTHLTRPALEGDLEGVRRVASELLRAIAEVRGKRG